MAGGPVIKKQTKLIAVLAPCLVLLVVLIVFATRLAPALLSHAPVYGIPLGGPAPTAASDAAYTFAFTGDTRNNDLVFSEIIRETMDQKCAFGVMGGDLVTNSSDAHYNDFCQNVVKTTGGKFPIYPAIGNHDWGNGIIEKMTGDRFIRFLGAENYVFWYGPDAFVLFDDSRDTGFTAAEAEAVDKMIQEVRPKARWLFLVCHVPPYDPTPGGSHCLQSVSAGRLMKLAVKNNATMLLTSHVHGFGQRTMEGIPVIVSGGAGAQLATGARFNWVKIAVDSKGVTAQEVELPAQFQSAEQGAAD